MPMMRVPRWRWPPAMRRTQCAPASSRPSARRSDSQPFGKKQFSLPLSADMAAWPQRSFSAVCSIAEWSAQLRRRTRRWRKCSVAAGPGWRSWRDVGSRLPPPPVRRSASFDVDMIRGVAGRLVTASFAREVLPGLPGAAPIPLESSRELASWARRSEGAIGPASSVRLIADAVLVPLLRVLGFAVVSRSDTAAESLLQVGCGNGANVVALAVGWNEPLTRTWRTAIFHTITADSAWCFCCNGTALRIVDARRTWSREFLEFDLAALGEDVEAQALLWSVGRAEAMAQDPSVLDRAAQLSARHGVEVCRALGGGVIDALRLVLGALAHRARGRYTPDLLFDHSLTVLYRVLFLLFAEARGLVPMWHPIYRDQYSLDAIVTTLLSGRRYRGLWLAVQAISRLAHVGCSAGDLTVTAFNGRLFAPSHAAAFERTRIDDDVMGRAVVAVSTTADNRTSGRARIAYRELDVEQLGAVYERVLDYQPAPADSGNVLVRSGDTRKSTGTFYTPRAVTSFLVRRTLDPLLAGRTAGEILSLRILDPAMGSGAFLVAACRHLAGAVEDALIREGRWHPHDVTPAGRATLRREIASRCLFGVDVNPMAVQLARLSLWLATLAADRPLSFLDHHLVAGNSLVGATPDDLRRQPTRSGRGSRRQADLPLLDDRTLAGTLAEGVRTRLKLATDPDDSASVVRAKEQTLTSLHNPEAPLGRWSRVLDLCCAGWFWQEGTAPDRRTFAELADRVVRGRCALPERLAGSLLAEADSVAVRHQFLHWPLAFPEIFTDRQGRPLDRPGFDAVIGNPPWDMVRGDSGDDGTREARRTDARRLADFVREAGIYQVAAKAHANRYQLFVERALQLVRDGGRVGLVLPSGIASDAGAAPLRRHLFGRANVDSVTGLDNREAIFPIHRSVRFVLLTCTSGRPTTELRCRFGITQLDDLERSDTESARREVVLSRRLLSRLSGDEDLCVPELTGEADLRLVERIAASIPRLGGEDGWGVHFGRELNATDDRGAFVLFTGDDSARAVVEGKQIEPFRVAIDRSRLQLRKGSKAGARVPHRARLAYRDVASASNRLTLIAAIVPPRAVTTHTLFCLKTPPPHAAQNVLCALLNSYVANYLVPLRVNPPVTVALVARLPVPLVRQGAPAFERLADLSRRVMNGDSPVEETSEYGELQALAARLYQLDAADFEHVLSTFPLVPAAVRAAALLRFNNLH